MPSETNELKKPLRRQQNSITPKISLPVDLFVDNSDGILRSVLQEGVYKSKELLVKDIKVIVDTLKQISQNFSVYKFGKRVQKISFTDITDIEEVIDFRDTATNIDSVLLHIRETLRQSERQTIFVLLSDFEQYPKSQFIDDFVKATLPIINFPTRSSLYVCYLNAYNKHSEISAFAILKRYSEYGGLELIETAQYTGMADNIQKKIRKTINALPQYIQTRKTVQITKLHIWYAISLICSLIAIGGTLYVGSKPINERTFFLNEGWTSIEGFEITREFRGLTFEINADIPDIRYVICVNDHTIEHKVEYEIYPELIKDLLWGSTENGKISFIRMLGTQKVLPGHYYVMQFERAKSLGGNSIPKRLLLDGTKLIDAYHNEKYRNDCIFVQNY